MPSLVARISADASQMEKEFKRIPGMAQRASNSIRANMGGAVHTPGLSMVGREILVIGREAASGNWSRMAGSFTRLLQGLNGMKAQFPVLGALFSWLGLSAGLAIAGIIGGFLIWRHRVKELTEALTGLKFPDLKPPDLTTLRAYETVWRNIASAVREATAETLAANAAFAQSKSLMREQHETDKTLLQLQKEKALKDAEGDPAKQAAIRAEYSKKEHDQEAKQNDESIRQMAEHAAALKKESYDKAVAANKIKVRSEKNETDDAEMLREQAMAGTEKGADGLSQLDKDQATVDRLNRQKTHWNFNHGIGLEEDEIAELGAAQGRLDVHANAKLRYDRNQITKKDRDERREHQKQLEAQSKSAAVEAVKLNADIPSQIALNAVKLANADKIRAAHDALDNDSGPGQAGVSRDRLMRGHVSSLQQIGAYAPAAVHAKEGHSIGTQILKHVADIAHAVGPHGNSDGPKF